MGNEILTKIGENTDNIAGPYKQLITDETGKAKWEDRLAYFETENTEILPKQTVHFNNRRGIYISEENDNQMLSSLIEGIELEIIFDGIKYNCIVCRDESKGLYFGNLVIVGGQEDTGEPFIYSISEKVFVTLQAGDSHVISITGNIRKYHEIDSSYIHQFCVNDMDIAGLPTPKHILNTEDHFTAAVGIITLKELITKRAVFDHIFCRKEGLMSFDFLRMENRGTLLYETNGTSRLQYRGIDLEKKDLCDVTFYFDGQSDDSVLTKIERSYPKSMHLKSSTENSSKMFEITVDDSGTLSATEVTT